jgi:carboxypeptidase Q
MTSFPLYHGLLALIIIFSLSSTSNAYDIAPVTDEMRASASAIISSFLPSTGVTKSSSSVWQRLAYITDTYGPRFSGSDSLENVLDHIRDTATADGLVVTEMEAFLPRWLRGVEYGSWTTNTRTKKLHLVGLGMSNTTGGINGGGVEISAPGIVISGSSPAEAYSNLLANCSLVQGKIVVFNVPFTTYGGTVGVRSSAGTWGAQCGAVAAIIRTIGAYSLQNPHTGATDQTAPIASAAVSIEDAEQMQRMQDRGTPFTLTLFMNSTWLPDRPSRNILIDVLGSENPGEVVAIGGHVDSWDIAEGAMGKFLNYQIIKRRPVFL